MKNSNGFVLFENELIAAIATGFRRPSKNPKTGEMIQVFILVKALDPVRAIKTGSDSLICGDCQFRLIVKKLKKKRIVIKGRRCYVRVYQAPLAIYRAWRRGAYPFLKPENFAQVFTGRAVRWGAYGDPAFVPFPIVSAISALASSWTGYTHQWKNPIFAQYKNFFMASADTLEDHESARAAGWRTFRVLVPGSAPAPGEIRCVNETRGIQCIDCKLCKGAAIGAKSIAIDAHGAGAGHFKK